MSFCITDLSAADNPSHIKIGVEEHLGLYAALGAEFRDESGSTVTLGSLIDRPTVIVPIYLSCKDVCPMLLSGVAQVVAKMEKKTDYRIVTVSFDETDAPENAMEMKKNFIEATGTTFSPEQWNFMTGSKENVRALMDSIGFYFQRQDDGTFIHTAALIVVSPGGRIARYLYGVTFLPFDLKMALAEASEGRVGSMGQKAMMYCFSYDPRGRTYVLNVLKLTGTVTLVFTGSFFAYLVATSRARRQHRDGTGT